MPREKGNVCVQKCTIKQKTCFASQRVYVCYTCRRTHRNRCCVELSKICFFLSPCSMELSLTFEVRPSEFRIQNTGNKIQFPIPISPIHLFQKMTKSLTAAELCQLVQDAHGRIAASVVTTRWGLSLEMDLPNRFQPQKRTEASPVLSASIPCTLYLKMEQLKVSESTDFEQTTPNNHFRSSARAASSFGGLTASCPRWNRERWRTSFHISVHTDLEP